jgi:hypothetical protein
MAAKLLDIIKAQLVRHEGLLLKPYCCTAGKFSSWFGALGLGWNSSLRAVFLSGFAKFITDYPADTSQLPAFPRISVN